MRLNSSKCWPDKYYFSQHEITLDRTVKPNTEVGNDADAGLRNGNVVQYEFTNSKGEKVTICQDQATTYSDGGYQAPHYNAGNSSDNKLKQHHYYE